LKVELPEASIAELPIMQRMGSFYVYDMSEYLGGQPGWEFPDNAEYPCDDLRPYFEDPGAETFFIRVDGELAGFAIVNRQGVTRDVDFNMAQFFVLRKFVGRGVGQEAAEWCFRKFRGVWNVMVIPGNLRAYGFWKKTIGRLVGGAFEEQRLAVPQLGNSQQDVFRFRT
jgi:predicted acetyltransferase